MKFIIFTMLTLVSIISANDFNATASNQTEYNCSIEIAIKNAPFHSKFFIITILVSFLVTSIVTIVHLLKLVNRLPSCTEKFSKKKVVESEQNDYKTIKEIIIHKETIETENKS